MFGMNSMIMEYKRYENLIIQNLLKFVDGLMSWGYTFSVICSDVSSNIWICDEYY